MISPLKPDAVSKALSAHFLQEPRFLLIFSLTPALYEHMLSHMELICLLRNQIHETYNEKWDIQIKKPDAWFCPKCELTFESKNMVKKHIAEMGCDEVFTDNDLSLDRKVLGVCRAVLEDGPGRKIKRILWQVLSNFGNPLVKDKLETLKGPS